MTLWGPNALARAQGAEEPPDEPTAPPAEPAAPPAEPAAPSAAPVASGSEQLGGESAAPESSGSASVPAAAPRSSGSAEGDAFAIEALSDLSLEELLDLTVTVATRTRTRLAATPSVVSVVTAEDIRRCQCRNLAEALRTVPGLYDVYDMVFHNIGIRGVNGGIRAGGSVVKVMIDGTPVSFAPSTANFFGPELIPIEMVERIEVIRGPASAIYGSNAFLGVINIVTRAVSSLPTATVYAHGGVIRDRPTVGGGAIVSRTLGRVELVLSAEASRVDRSGLRLPSSSPLLDSATLAFDPNTRSNDLSMPLSFFGRMSIHEVGPGTLEVWASAQRLDAAGEFQDLEPLTHRTRLVLDQETVRLGYALDPIDTLGRPDNLELRFNAVYFRSVPGRQNRINLGSIQEDYLRRVSTQGALVYGELTWTPRERLSFFARTDVRVERHVLQHYDSLLLRDVLALDGSVLLPAGLVVPGAVYGDGRATFTNVGVQAQLEYALNDAWRFTAGTRLDVHSVYGAQFSPRAAIVLAPEDAHYHLKAMFGSSFKAPSAAQLYTSPVREFDVQGNPNLNQQQARTYELAGGYEFEDIGYITVNGFATQIQGRVEYLQQGLFLSAENTLEEWYAGGEFETRIKPVTGLDLHMSVAYARQVRRERRGASVVINAAEVTQPLYPALQFHAQASYESTVRMHPGAYARFSYVGPRTASDQNAALNGASYELPGYGVLDLAFTAHEEFWEGRSSRFGVKVENVLDRRYVNPGFGGVDLPALGRSVLITFAQEL